MPGNPHRSPEAALGWEIDAAHPDRQRAARWLADGQSLTGADGIAAMCETARGETVFIELRDGRLLISDRGQTCRYLEAGDWAHRPLSIERIRELCEEREAQLVDVPEMWPHITVTAERAQTPAQAVAVVGLAIEHVFAAALAVPAD